MWRQIPGNRIPSQQDGIRIFTCMRLFLVLFLCLTAAAVSGQVSKLHSRAENGDSKAMLELSEKYLFGLGVKKSDDSSRYWADQALKADDPEAQYLVGVRHTASAFDMTTFSKGIDLVDLRREEAGVKIAPLPSRPIEKAIARAGLLARIIQRRPEPYARPQHP